jgi:isopentenyl-diphosphate delta-isomerase
MVELVDSTGRARGEAEKLAAHQAPGQLHRAFSVFLFRPDGKMLVQQRALAKYHSPGVWSNACCGHPEPGEDTLAAAARRTAEELGCAPPQLSEAGTVTYRLTDEATGLVEHEFNHLFVGRSPQSLAPDPAEVQATRYLTLDELAQSRRHQQWSVWFGTVLGAAWPAIEELGLAGGLSPSRSR